MSRMDHKERLVVKTILQALETPAARETEVKRLPLRAGLITAFLFMFGGLAGLTLLTAPSASADEPTNTSVSETDPASSEEEPPSCEGMDVEEGTGECADVVESESHSRSSSQSRAVSVNGVSIHSRVTVLARIRANGTPPSQQNNCFHTNRAMSLWTSYNAAGTTGWHWKFYPKGYRFCRINGAVRDPKCHNQVKIGVPKSKPPKNAIRGEVKFVKRLRWHVKAVAKADEKVTSHAKAWCNTQSAYAYGEGRGSATAYAVGRGSARGSVLVKVLVKARMQAAGDLSLQLGGKSVIKVKAEVRATAFAKATSEAHAKAVCTDKPPTVEAPVFVQFREVNDLEVNWTADHCVTVDTPDGHTATVYWEANFGSFAIPQKIAQDGVQICSVYKAPSEVPAGGTDRITVRAVDNVTGKSVTRTTDPFVIHPTAPHPG